MLTKQAELVQELQQRVIDTMRSSGWVQDLAPATQALSTALQDYQSLHYFHTLNPDQEEKQQEVNG